MGSGSSVVVDAGALTSALLPTALLIGLGWALRSRWRFADAYWTDLERLTYFVLLPALFVSSLARAEFGSLQPGRLAVVLAVSTLLAAGVVWGLRRWITDDGRAFTSVFQGGVRFNNYIGLVVATALLGADGLALAALCNAVLVPLVNITSTLTLARHGDRPAGRAGWRGVVAAVASNPLVLACVAGMVLHLAARTDAGAATLDAPVVGVLIASLGEFLRILGAAALPIGLLCVGAGLRRPEGAAATGRLVAWAMGLRFLVVPGLTVGVVALAGLTGASALVAILFQSIPTASSAYVLARRLGGDAPLMAAITAAQTVAGLATIPLWLLVSAQF